MESLKTQAPFDSIFPINNSVLTSITVDMRRNGFDQAHPIITWNGIVIDGHTRLQAATLAGLDDVPVIERDFKNEDAAVRYAIACQRDRRNLTDADIVRLVKELDKRRSKGERTDLASSEAKSTQGKSADITAEAIGTSRSKVEKVRAIEAKATPEVKSALDAGDITINAAHQSTLKTEKQQRKKSTRSEGVATTHDTADADTLKRVWRKVGKKDREKFLAWVDRERTRDLPKGTLGELLVATSKLARILKRNPEQSDYVKHQLGLMS